MGRRLVQLVKNTINEFNKDDAFAISAALAYYTLLSLAPLLILLVGIAGLVWGNDAGVQERFINQIRPLVGDNVAQTSAELIKSTKLEQTGLIGTIVGLATLLMGASGAFYQLQNALNKIWHVAPPENASWMYLIKRRSFSFLAVLATGILLAATFLLSTFLTMMMKYFSDYLPVPGIVLQAWNWVLSLGVLTLLFSLIFRLLPDIRIPWSDVWTGGLVTAILFQLGNITISYYLATTSATSAFGAASSIVALLIWINYSALIFLLGAEFTQVYADLQGSHPDRSPDPEALPA